MKYTIVNYPGTIYSSIEMDGLDKETLMQIVNETIISDTDSDDFRRFIKAFLIDGMHLTDVPAATGLKESTCSAWASDIIPTVANAFKKIKLERIQQRQQMKKENSKESKSSNGNGFDIYKYAEEYDADYYDMRTGYTYLVQEYNRARKFGLPTYGIRVVESGRVIGYARKSDE